MDNPKGPEGRNSNSRPSWAGLLAFWPRLPIWKKLDGAIAGLAAYTAAVVLAVGETDFQLPEWSGGSAILNALVLGLLLGFRNQEAYNRWWEARRLWGQLINDSRALCAKAAALPELSAAARGGLTQLVPGFALAVKLHLRSEGGLREVPGFEGADVEPTHVPLFLFGRITALLQSERSAGRATETDLLLLDPHIRSLIDVSGGCERIANTPIPPSYRALLRHGLVLYLLSTPWLIAGHLAWWTIPVMALLGYFLLGIELTAEAVEEPFGREEDDLALTAYCETIRRSADQVFAYRTGDDSPRLCPS